DPEPGARPARREPARELRDVREAVGGQRREVRAQLSDEVVRRAVATRRHHEAQTLLEAEGADVEVERVSGERRYPIGEPTCTEDRQVPLHVADGVRPDGNTPEGELGDPRMPPHHLALVARGPLDLLAPTLRDGLRHRQLADDPVEDELKELLLVLDVPEDCARADPELFCVASYREVG